MNVRMKREDEVLSSKEEAFWTLNEHLLGTEADGKRKCEQRQIETAKLEKATAMIWKW